MNDTTRSLWRSRSGPAFAAFLGIAGYFLWTEHQAHVIEALPWLFIAACVGVHLFMHRGHGGGHGHGAEDEAPNRHNPDGGR